MRASRARPARIGYGLLAVLLVAAGGGAYLLRGYGGAAGEPAVTAAPDFTLLDRAGRSHELYRYRGARAIVLASYDPRCPSAPRELEAVRRLLGDHRDPGVVFLMLDPAADRSAEGGMADADSGPAVLEDDAQIVGEALHLHQTGEALLLDPKTWRIVYRGPVAAGDLAAALDGFLAGKPVPATSPPPAAGCAIARGGDGRKGAEISYTADIVPLLRQKCVACHRTAGIAPWRMDRLATIAEWSPRIRKAILNATMPPWDADPHYGKFADDRSLSPEQKRLLTRWIDAGAPGSASDDPLAAEPPPPAEFWPLGKPDLVVDLPVQKIPATGVLDRRLVEMTVPKTANRWLRAVDAKPSNPAVSHHITAWYRLPDEEPVQAFYKHGFIAAYLPGHQPGPLPDDSGLLLPEGAILVFDLHYTTDGKEETDAPKLALYFRDEPPAREFHSGGVNVVRFTITPGDPDYPLTASEYLQEPITLYALMPHMHLRGKQFRFSARFPDGHSEILLSVPRYRFNWQTEYTLAVPRQLPAGITLLFDGTFDNSADNPSNPDPTQAIEFGWQTNEEMFTGLTLYTRPRRIDPALAAKSQPSQ